MNLSNFKDHRLFLLTVIVFASFFFGSNCLSAISYRASSSTRTTSNYLTLNVPNGTVADDLMVATVTFRPCSSYNGGACTKPLYVPSGWAVVRGINTTTGAGSGGYGSRHLVFTRVATDSEPASYSWQITGNPAQAGALGSIATFSGVDPSDPVVAESGYNTSYSSTHTAPSINTGSVANTMLVSSHSVNSSGTWTPPNGMTEMTDIYSYWGINDLGISLETNYQLQAGVGSTGTKSARLSRPPNGDTGAAHLLALRPLSVSAIPVAEYRLDECEWDGTSGEVKDSSGNNLHGTAVLSPVSIDISAESGGVCQAASMGGVSHLAIPDNDLLDIPNNLTVMSWIRPDSIPASGLKSILSKDTNYEYHVNSNGQIYWWWRSSGSSFTLTTTSLNLSVGSWYHVAIRFQSGTATILVNGVPSITRSGYPATLDLNSDPLQLGGDYIGTRYFEGVIDEILIFDSALDDGTVRNMYTSQLNNNNYDGTTRLCSDCGQLSETFVLSTKLGGARLGAPALTMDESDLVEYTPSTKNATLVEELNDLFNWGWNVANAIHIHGDGDIYFSSEETALANNGVSIDGDDILKYDRSTQILTKVFDGDDHFTNSGENIDALHILENGNIILSTSGSARLGGVTFQDDDLVQYNPVTKVATMYFNGGDHFSGNRDLNGVHIIDNEQMLFSMDGDAQVGALSFRAGDVVLYSITPRVGRIFFDGVAEFGSWQDIDGITTLKNPVAIDHYEIRHDGSALTCNPEDILIVACETANCAVLAGVSSTVTLTPTGWIPDDEVAFVGSETVQLRHTTPETVTLGLTNQNPIATDGYKCVAFIGGPEVSCDIEFHDSGFDFSVPTQTSCKISGSITLSAIRKDDTGIRCVPAFSNRTATIDFWSTYISPGSGVNQMQVNSTTVSTGYPGTGISLDFDVNGQATFTVVYSDAGQLQLDARFEGAGDEAGLEMTGNSTFVTHPAGLCVYSDGAGNECVSGDGTCSTFVVAGTDFPLKVKGVCWESDGETDDEFCDTNPTTSNYLHAGIGISHTLVAPATGVSGAITATTANIVTGGEVNISESVSEVGVFTFTADPPSDYLGAGDVFSGATYTSSNIGRFIPDHFIVAITPDPPTFFESCDVFTYLGEPFDWDTVPDVTITAMNGAVTSQQTVNYEGGFWKLDTTLNYSYFDNNVPVDASPLTPQTSSQTLPDTVDCGGTVTVSFSEDDGVPGNGSREGFNYTRPDPSSPIAPFIPDVTMTVDMDELTDSDGVCLESGSGCEPFEVGGITGLNVRHGRALAEAVFGPEISPLVMPVSTFYYNATDWVLNSDDDCSSYSFVANANGVTVDVAPSTPVVISGGEGDLTLTPTNGTQGWVTVDFDFPLWLHPDPSAVATFGISRGNDRIINWQETTR